MSEKKSVTSSSGDHGEYTLDRLAHGTLEAAGADEAMRERARRGAALTRSFQAESMATKAPVAPSGLVALGLAVVVLFMTSTVLSLGDTAVGNDVSLRDVLLAVILAFTTFWWYGVGPADPKPAGLCGLCAVFLLATGGAGLFDPPASVRVLDLLAAVLILLGTIVRLSASWAHPDSEQRDS